MKSKTKRHAGHTTRHPQAQPALVSRGGGGRQRSVRRLLAVWLGPVAIALSGIAMLAWTWRTWPDVLIDFGRELYVPWRLSAGAVLYRDIAYFNGPLAPYWNALWFWLFGPSLMTLVTVNLLLLALLTALLYGLLAQVGTRLGATVACLVLVVVFACSQLLSVGNYNFVAPYSHDLTHGVLLSVAAIGCLSLYLRSRRRVFAGAAGLAVGLLSLTKVDPFIAGGAATVTGFGLALAQERPARRRLLEVAAAFAGAAAVPPALAFLLFWLVLPAGQALREPIGHWLAAAHPELRSLPFYRDGMGIENVGASVRMILNATLWYGVVLAPAALAALALRKPGRHRAVVAGALFVGVAVVLGLRWREIGWARVANPLPLFLLALAIGPLVAFLAHRRDPDGDPRPVLRLSLIVLAFGLMLKMILNARIHHYGFALAMPATLLCVLALVDWVPAALDRLGGYGAAFRAASLAMIAVGTAAMLVAIDAQVGLRRARVADGADAFLSDGRGLFVNRALEELRYRARPDSTLAVLPEGVMINYLARRVSPTPYVSFIPVEIALFGEERMLSSLKAHPPDYVMLTHRDTSEYGVQYFGRDYGARIHEWLMAHYRPITLIGSMPLRDGRFGILLLQRRDGG